MLMTYVYFVFIFYSNKSYHFIGELDYTFFTSHTPTSTPTPTHTYPTNHQHKFLQYYDVLDQYRFDCIVSI